MERSFCSLGTTAMLAAKTSKSLFTLFCQHTRMESNVTISDIWKHKRDTEER